MANYTAVISSDIPGPNAVMEPGKSGLLVPKQDPEALAKKKGKEPSRRGLRYGGCCYSRVVNCFCAPLMAPFE